MTKEEIFNGLAEVLALVKPKLDLSTVTMDSLLLQDLGIDSLSMLMLSLGAESKFGIRFEAKEPFSTVGEVVDYIEKSL